MALKINKVFSVLILSKNLQRLRRRIKAMGRKLASKRAEVLYFHQIDDPYSQLTAQVLQDLQSRYDIDLKVLLVDAPSDEAAPEREALIAYSRRDAAKIAPYHGLEYTDSGSQPSEASLTLARRAMAASSNRAQVAASIGALFWQDDTDKLDRLAVVSHEKTRDEFAHGTKTRQNLRMEA